MHEWKLQNLFEHNIKGVQNCTSLLLFSDSQRETLALREAIKAAGTSDELIAAVPRGPRLSTTLTAQPLPNESNNVPVKMEFCAESWFQLNLP